MTVTRRRVLQTGATLAVGTLATPAILRHALADDPIKFGSVLDTSGIFDAYGQPMAMAQELAVDEINAAGGVLGRQVEITLYDTQSDMALYTQYAQQLARRDQVDVVHGGILSASREAIRPTLRRSGILYFYNVLHEGGVCDRNIFITGTEPSQQVAVVVPEAIKRWGPRIYTLAADYGYGQITAKWIEKYAADSGGEVIQTDFFPLDVSDFGSTIAKIQTAGPDILVSALVGGAHLSFYRQWAAAGMKDRIPMASSSLGVGNEHKILTPEEGDGILVAYNYSQELDTPENQAFLAAWEAKFGDTTMIHEIAASNYQGVHLWAKAVEAAGTLDRMAVIEAAEGGLAFQGPGGLITIDAKTHHVIADIHLMEFQDQKMPVIETFPQQQPIGTQAVCDLEANPDETQQFDIRF